MCFLVKYGTSLMILLHWSAYLEREILDLQTFDYALFFCRWLVVKDSFIAYLR